MTKERDELETEFTRDTKSCQPPCTDQFPILRPKQLNDDLIDYNIQYQSEDIENLIIQYDVRYTDLEDEELVTLIDMIIDSGDVFSQYKFDIGQTKQKLHVILKLNSELKKNDLASAPFILKTNYKKYLGNSSIAITSEKWEIMMNWDHFSLIQSY